MQRWCGRLALLGALGVVLALPLAQVRAEAAAGAPDAGSVRGQVRLWRQQPLLGLREAEDRSGIVVYVTGFTRPAPQELARLHQRNEQFEPRVLPIVSGQAVTFPNHDRIYHNVFSVSPVHPFDLGQYKSSDPPRDIRFDQPGLVTVYCNIHPQMMSYVVVLENEAFAQTGPDGAFRIDGVPAGEHELHAWAPGAERASRTIRVAPGSETTIELELRQVERIAPHKRKDGSDYPKPGYEDE
jgi:plastocyanin